MSFPLGFSLDRSLCACILAGSLPAALAGQGGSIEKASASISPEDVAQHVGGIAHDSMRGRPAPSRELDRVGDYVAAAFRRFGLEPGGEDGTYFQEYWLERVEVLADSCAVQVGGPHGPDWVHGRDFLFPFNDWPAGEVEAAVVFLTGALSAPAAFDTTLLAGKVLAVLAHPQPELPYERLMAWRPAAVLLETSFSPAELSGYADMLGLSKPMVRSPRSGGGFPMALLRRDAFQSVLGDRENALVAHQDAGDSLRASVAADLEAHVRLDVRLVERASTANVIGMLRGRDPGLRDEFVVYTAHMDHLGVGAPVAGDSIYNGADDNASGVAALLELAEAFSMLPERPRRSVLFVALSTEERLGWGSQYFVDHPPVPLSRMVANVNADMIGRGSRETVIVEGLGDSDLGEIVRGVVEAHPELEIALVPNPLPELDLYTFSDHVHFFQKGIPFLYFFGGMHEDYHQPGDEPERLDAEKVSRVAKLMFHVGLEVANQDRRPEWDPDRYRELVKPHEGRPR